MTELNRRQRAKAETTAKVLAGAEALYRDRGYNATTTRDLARHIGMSTGAIFATCPGGLTELWTRVTGLPVPGSQPWTPATSEEEALRTVLASHFTDDNEKYGELINGTLNDAIRVIAGWMHDQTRPLMILDPDGSIRALATVPAGGPIEVKLSDLPGQAAALQEFFTAATMAGQDTALNGVIAMLKATETEPGTRADAIAAIEAARDSFVAARGDFTYPAGVAPLLQPDPAIVAAAEDAAGQA